MLVAKIVSSPHAHARITKIDTRAAEGISGVRAVEIFNDVGAEIQWIGTEIVALAADTEEIARDAVAAVKVEYEVLPHLVKEEEVDKAGDRVKRRRTRQQAIRTRPLGKPVRCTKAITGWQRSPIAATSRMDR